MMETEKDETKRCVFHGFLKMSSFDRNDTFVKLPDQRSSKIKDSSVKRQDGLQLNLEPLQYKLYSHNGCYLHYTSSSCIAKYLKRLPSTQKCANIYTSGQTKATKIATFQFHRKQLLALCGEMCSLTPDLRNPSSCEKSILCRSAGRSKGKKVSRMSYCRYGLLYQ